MHKLEIYFPDVKERESKDAECKRIQATRIDLRLLFMSVAFKGANCVDAIVLILRIFENTTSCPIPPHFWPQIAQRV